MVTKVGMQADFASALKDLIELEYDAIEAYEAAINRLSNQEYKSKMQEFKSDHTRHIGELSEILAKHNEEAPTGPSIGKQWLAKGKVILGGLVGDNTILAAMLSNELDTNTAYERLNTHSDEWADAVVVIARGLADERRHKAWLEVTVQNKETV